MKQRLCFHRLRLTLLFANLFRERRHRRVQNRILGKIIGLVQKLRQLLLELTERRHVPPNGVAEPEKPGKTAKPTATSAEVQRVFRPKACLNPVAISA